MPIKFLRRQFHNYFQEFVHDSRAVGVMLFLCTVISLVLANLSFGEAYAGLFTHEWHFMETLHLPHSPGHWINDGLMAIFFFLVGMEIKRELTIGELASVKRAMLPVAAAVGGMLIPAAFYLIFNHSTAFEGGWGIPMATDIAFSLGVASMLGSKVPTNLKIFLTALAIIDDLGAILVIALFYGSGVKALFLLGAALIMGILWLLNKKGVPFGKYHYLLGVLLWYLIFNSGIHATIAGVLFAFMVPQYKLSDLEHNLHNYVNFLILPIFALANTAIVLNMPLGEALATPLSMGIIVGLFLGKPVGVVIASWAMVRLKLAELPRGLQWSHMTGAGILAGIGFTMSIFITCLAFKEVATQDIGKIAILASALLSVVAAIGWFALIGGKKPATAPKAKPAKPPVAKA